MMSNPDFHERVKERAYHIYLSSRCTDESRNWAQAVNDIRDFYKRVEERAYYIYLNTGCTDESRNWFQAMNQEQYSFLDSDALCIICYDALLYQKTSKCKTCGNLVHSNCIQKWLALNPRCIYCRWPFNYY